MALRTNTVEYPMGTLTTSLATATRNDFAAVTLYIPETSSRTFRSAVIEISVRDNQGTAASITAWLIGIKLGAVAFNDVTTTLTLTNSGDHQAYMFTRDVTSYFNTNFGAGTSQTCQVGVTITGIASLPISAKLILTYEYDDSAQDTRLKTVRIPLEGPTGQLTSTLTEIGTNQVPALDTFLPEASKVYRQIWFESFYNDGGNSTTGYNLALALDAEAEVSRGVLNQTLNSAVWGKDLWVRNDMTTNATHAFKARSNAVTARFNIGFVLCVTYEYSHTSSSTLINSLVIPFGEQSYTGATTATDQSRTLVDVWIEEPATISLVQSGIVGVINEGSTTHNCVIKVGSQTTRTYAMTMGSVNSGPLHFSHRIDSGSAGGAALTLARGKNTLVIDVYTSQSGTISPFGGLLMLNYTSGKHASGGGVHNHSTAWSICDHANALATRRVLTSMQSVPNIPETNFFITSVGYVAYGDQTGPAIQTFALNLEIKSGEFNSDGWILSALQLQRNADAEAGVFIAWCSSLPVWQRYVGDPDTNRLAIETSRQVSVESGAGVSIGGYMWLTYHAITFTISGSVQQYSGDGSGITVDLFDTTTREWLATTTTAIGGGYSFTWYDNTANNYTVAQQSGTRAGRGLDGTAT